MRTNSGKNKIPKRAPVIALVLLMAFIFPLHCSRASIVMESSVPDISGPLQESCVIWLSIQSAHMGIKVPFMVYLPKGYGGKDAYPVWYGLHSYSTTETMWLTIAGAGKIADDLIDSGELAPMIMVFPLTRYDSAKVIKEDMLDGKRDASRMEQFLCGELVPYIDTQFDTVKDREGRYIGGFSMGGFLALETAFHHPDLFLKVGAYSPTLLYSDFSGKQMEKWLYPNDDMEKVSDAAEFSKEKGFNKLQVYLDCGSVNEPFSDGAQSLYAALQKRGISVKFQMHSGGHSLQLDKIGEYLKFYCGK
jgi:enterochelin esterase-like enzyme